MAQEPIAAVVVKRLVLGRDLDIRDTTVNITGTPRKVMLINGMLPGPVLHWREGYIVTLPVPTCALRLARGWSGNEPPPDAHALNVQPDECIERVVIRCVTSSTVVV
ncbi:MAG: multicopper oxidase domain-containing protein [Alphaproteobacteria bacterium]|nr:multicopper oxidase domain-containing protein [Alphaproteobacteria bacterium]MDE2493691.1 multicopper oxidase domain-containing protein [Alphaproteobacteria bacterium]